MKSQFLLAAVCLLTVSCSRYQYFTIQSQHAKTNEAQELVIENDSLVITYNFNGLGAPVQVKVENKLNKPVFVDWKRSSLILDSQAVSYMPEAVNIAGSTSGSSLALTRDVAVHGSDFYATATIPADWQMVPPRTYISKTTLYVTKGFFNNVPEYMYYRKSVDVAPGRIKKMKMADFTVENTPMRFRSFLTVQIPEGTAQHMVFYEHEFYISNLVETNSGPDLLPLDKKKGGNRAYVRKTTGAGAGLAMLGVAAVVGVMVAAANETGQQSQQGGN